MADSIISLSPGRNIAFVESQFLNALYDGHWVALMHILRYIKNAPGHIPLYEDKDNAKIVYYSNADWVGSPSDKRSTSAIVFLLEIIQSHVEARRRIRLLDPVLKLNSMPWQQLQVKLHGLGNLSNSFSLETLRALSLFAIIKPLFTLHLIRSSMNELNTEIDCHFVREKVL